MGPKDFLDAMDAEVVAGASIDAMICALRVATCRANSDPKAVGCVALSLGELWGDSTDEGVHLGYLRNSLSRSWTSRSRWL